MLKAIFLIGILTILSCGNKDKSKIENKKFTDKIEKYPRLGKNFDKKNTKNDNKGKFFDMNGNEISFFNFNIKNSAEVVKKNKNTKKSKVSYFLTSQRGFFSVGASEPKIEIEDALESVLFFIKFSTGNLFSTTTLLKDYPSLDEIIKEKNQIDKYDEDNFLNFIDLFKLEGINKVDPEIPVLIIDLGSKYKLMLKKEIVEAKDLDQILKSSFFQLSYVREEVIERLKKSGKKFEKEIKEIEDNKSLLIKNEKFQKFSKEFKYELYKISNQILGEAKVFLNKFELEIVEMANLGSYKVEIKIN